MPFYSSLVLLVDTTKNSWSLEAFRIWDEDRYFGDGFRSISPAIGSVSLESGLEIVDFGPGSGHTIIYEFKLNDGLAGTNFAPGLRLSDGKYLLLPQSDGTFAGRKPTDFTEVAFASATTFGGPGTLPALNQYSRYGFREAADIDVPDIGGTLVELFRSQSQFQSSGGTSETEKDGQIFLYEGRTYQLGVSDDVSVDVEITGQDGQSVQLVANEAGGSFSPEISGYHEITVSHQDDFSLQIRNDDHGDDRADATSVGVGRIITGEFNGPSDVDFFAVGLGANQNVKIDVENFVVTQRGVSLTIFDENGLQLASRSGTDTATMVFAPDESGTYFIRTQGWSDFSQDTPTRYSLSVEPQAVQQAPAPATSIGEDNRYYQDWTHRSYQDTQGDIVIKTDTSPRSVHSIYDDVADVIYEAGDVNTSSQTVITGGMQAVLPSDLSRLKASGVTLSPLFERATEIGLNSGVPELRQSSPLMKSASIFQEEGLGAGLRNWGQVFAEGVEGVFDWLKGAFGPSRSSRKALESSFYSSASPTTAETTGEFRSESYDLMFNFGGHELVLQNQFSALHTTKPGVAVDQIEFDDGVILNVRAPGAQGNEEDELLVSIDPNAPISAGVGNDLMLGASFAVDFQGDEGRDVLRGSVQADRLSGGSDNDALLGGAGDDSLYGGGGDDTLSPDAGYNLADGGEGTDLLIINQNIGSYSIVVNGDEVSLTSNDQSVAVANVEIFQFRDVTKFLTELDDPTPSVTPSPIDPVSPVDPPNPSEPVDPAAPVDLPNPTVPQDPVEPPAPIGPTAGDDTLLGTALSDTIKALAGNDNIDGLASDDLLLGSGGNDNIRGGGGDDTVKGGGGSDNLFGNGGADLVLGNGGADTIRAGGGADEARGGGGADDILGGGGADTLRGNGGGDALRGNGGADDINGGGGSDLILGGGGADRLVGAGGNDTLRGDGGNDVFIGGNGRDVFQFRTNDRIETIQDFRQGQDRIEILSGAGSFAALDIQQDGVDVLIGFGRTEIRVLTDGAAAFDEDDFIF